MIKKIISIKDNFLFAKQAWDENMIERFEDNHCHIWCKPRDHMVTQPTRKDTNSQKGK